MKRKRKYNKYPALFGPGQIDFEKCDSPEKPTQHRKKKSKDDLKKPKRYLWKN